MADEPSGTPPTPIPLAPSSKEAVTSHMERLKVHSTGQEIMTPKGRHHSILIEGLNSLEANFLKQGLLSLGGEVALPYHLIGESPEKGRCIAMGTTSQFEKLAARLELQPYGLAALGKRILTTVEALDRPIRLNVWWTVEVDTPTGSRKLEVGERTLIMGILNVTPDSFYDGGNYPDVTAAVEAAKQMVAEGADVIDIGGESSRPFAEPVTLEEELERVIPVIEALAPELEVPISIDTYKPEVAAKALDAGASIVNDISGLRNEEMIALVAERKVPVVLMHMLGEPRNMQTDPKYEDAPSEIYAYLHIQVQKAVAAGILPQHIIIDPGIGFGKTVSNNLEVLERLHSFRGLGCPVLVGASNKSFIGAVLDKEVDARLTGSVAAAVAAVMRGGDIVRVHNVAETKEAVDLADAILKASH